MSAGASATFCSPARRAPSWRTRASNRKASRACSCLRQPSITLSLAPPHAASCSSGTQSAGFE
eukprot:scaffold68211_cov51-Phaeocystis_antarctica.AAC.4